MAVYRVQDNIQVVMWDGSEPIGDLTAERVAEIQGVFDGPLVAVVIDGGVNIIQPMNPQTGQNWESAQDALEFGYRYLGLNTDGTPLATEPTE